MAIFELNIYGKNDEIEKTYATDRVRWGVFLQALELQEQIAGETVEEQFKAINEFVKQIFPELTDADLAKADIDDVLNTFKQLLNKASKIGVKTKNLKGAE